MVRYTEIALKGKNRGAFENRLVDNIKKYMENHGVKYKKIKKIAGRIIIEADDKCDFLKYVFGIHSFSYALCVKATVENISAEIPDLVRDMEFESFRVSTRRVDKSFPMKTYDMDCHIGGVIIDNFDKKVSLKEFDLDVAIEIIEGQAYIYTEKKFAYAGMPVGTGGTISVLTDYPNYELAAWYVMKRGSSVTFCGKQKPELKFLEKFMIREPNHYPELFEDEKSVVIGVTARDFIDTKIENIDMLLSPLVGMTDDEIREKIEDLISA